MDLYRLLVEQAYKGVPPARLRFFTCRDSGGFCMDRAGAGLPAGHDSGGDYLLFLNPVDSSRDAPRETSGAVFVDYNRGHSGLWSDLKPSERQILEGRTSTTG